MNDKRNVILSAEPWFRKNVSKKDIADLINIFAANIERTGAVPGRMVTGFAKINRRGPKQVRCDLMYLGEDAWRADLQLWPFDVTPTALA